MLRDYYPDVKFMGIKYTGALAQKTIPVDLEKFQKRWEALAHKAKAIAV